MNGSAHELGACMHWVPAIAGVQTKRVFTVVAVQKRVFAGVAAQPLWRQWSQYLFAMTGGFAVNYGAYALLVYRHELVREWPVIGVAVGSLLGLVVNFLSSRFWVFRHRAGPH